MRLHPVVAIVPLLLPQPSLAQNPDLDLSRLVPRLDSMSITLVRSGREIAVGQLWDEIVLDSTLRGPRLRRIYRTVNQVFGAHLDTTFVLYPGLQPSSRRTRAKLFEDSVVTANGHVTGWFRTAQGAVKTLDMAIGPEVIDASLFDAAVRAAPLGLGYHLQLTGLSPGEDSLLTLRAEVTGEAAQVQRDGRQVATWVVKMDFGSLASTMWIGKEDRALVRQVIVLSPDIQMLMQR